MADVKALVDVVLAVARLAAACGERLVELDLNPVVVQRKGAVAVDSLVVDGGLSPWISNFPTTSRHCRSRCAPSSSASAPCRWCAAVVEEHKHAEELWARMVELDWPALTVPEDDGGLGSRLRRAGRGVPSSWAGCSPRRPSSPRPAQFVPALRGRRRRRAARTASWGPWRGATLVGTLAVAEAAGSFDAAA